ncbi:hypothetical protein ACFL1Y_01260 [Patescibacteria group bacterium]
MSYSWGDDSGDSSRSSKSGYDYRSAREAYKEEPTPKASSMKSTTAESRKSAYKSRIGKTDAPVGKDVQSKSTHPIVVATDVTGSMSKWPGIIFEKLPLLGKEVERYAPKYEISFVAFGDAYNDSYPLQVRDFASGEALDEHVHALYPEGQGGPAPENPDLVAYYYLNHCKMDKAVKPIFIFITDVRSHTTLKSSAIQKYTGDDAQSSLDSVAVLKKLAEKFSVYVFLKEMDDRIFWEKIYGAQKVKPIEEPRDVVELIIGVIASELGELKDFEMRSSKRHADKPDRVKRVMKSVKDGTEETDPESAGKAKTAKKSDKSMKSKKLV